MVFIRKKKGHVLIRVKKLHLREREQGITEKEKVHLLTSKRGTNQSKNWASYQRLKREFSCI